MDKRFIGTGVAIVTPFQQYEIDYEGLTRVVDHVIKGGVDYIVGLGSTGEMATLSPDEERKVLDHLIKVIDDRVPLVAGNFGGSNTKALTEKLNSYSFKGISAILSSSPSYVKPSQEGIFRHYMELEKASPVPIILYNVPGRTSSNMDWSTTIKLAKASTKFIAIKEASGDLIQASRIVKNAPDSFFVTSGDDELAMPMVACGGKGVISVMANALPQSFSGMIKAALEGDFAKARALNFSTYDLHKWLYIEGNPVGIKSALKVLGLCSNEVRLPLHPLSSDNYNKLKEEMDRIQSLQS